MSATRVDERLRGGVGESVGRIDGVPKVKGAFAYGADLWAEGMLWGMTVRSPLAYARVLSIDISEAVASPGVHAVLTQDDVPGKKEFGLEFSDQPVLASDVVRYFGEPVAIVAAEHPEQARRAAARVKVEYEALPPLVDMEAALRGDAPQLHPWGNVLRHVHIEHGDPSAGAEVWVEGYYETGMQDQAPLGPEGGLAIPADDGGIDLYVSTQWLHVDRQQIAPCLRLPEEKVRIYLAGMGGAFGSREDVSMQIHACMLAMRTGKPVKMTYGREESFVGHVHRHPFRMWVRTGATKDGKLVNIHARLIADGGAYASSSPAVIGNATTFAAGPYEVPNALLDGTAVYTNNPPCGAMRGFGAPQVCFAHEAQMDKLAAALGMDPIELRLANIVGHGSVLPTGQVVNGSAPAREVVERCLAIPMPETDRCSRSLDAPRRGRERDARRGPPPRGRVRRGLQEHRVQRRLRRLHGGGDHPDERSRWPGGGGAFRGGGRRPGGAHGRRADRPDRARRARGRRPPAGYRGDRVGRFELRLPPDADGRWRRAPDVPGGPGSAVRTGPGVRRVRRPHGCGRTGPDGRFAGRFDLGPPRRTDHRTPHLPSPAHHRRWTTRARATSTSSSRSPRSVPWSRWTRSSGWCAFCRSPRRSTWARPSTRRACVDRSKGGRRRGSAWRCWRRSS